MIVNRHCTENPTYWAVSQLGLMGSSPIGYSITLPGELNFVTSPPFSRTTSAEPVVRVFRVQNMCSFFEHRIRRSP
jgi:hypothetical protein